MPETDLLQQFRIDRSINAAKAANENSRVMAQAAMLINGGAATAVIALLSKEQIDQNFYRAIPPSLWGYAFGAFFAWAGMFMMTECLDLFNKLWHERAESKPPGVIARTRKLAFVTWWIYRTLYVASAICFLYASVKLAYALSGIIPAPPACAPT
jgi:hypothetical protein